MRTSWREDAIRPASVDTMDVDSAASAVVATGPELARDQQLQYTGKSTNAAGWRIPERYQDHGAPPRVVKLLVELLVGEELAGHAGIGAWHCMVYCSQPYV